MFATSSSSSAFALRCLASISCGRGRNAQSAGRFVMGGRSTYLIPPRPLIALLFDTLHLTFEMLRLDIHLSESATPQISEARQRRARRQTKTHFSTASFRFFSAVSSSSSSSLILRVRESLVALPRSASSKVAFVLTKFSSVSWREPSRRPSL